MPNCSPPSYSYRPDFIESSVTCVMDTHQELRGRTPVGLGGTFFRTKNTGIDQNLLSIELVYDGGEDLFTLFVRDDGVLVETWEPGSGSPAFSPLLTGQGAPDVDNNCTGNLIPILRGIINSESNYIEMPELDYGGAEINSGEDPIFDADDNVIIAGDAGCLDPFSEINFIGADGGPSTGPTTIGSPSETQPRTGPERTLYGITLTEIVNNDFNDDGHSHNPVPPAEDKIMQWNGTAWIQYQPQVCI